MPGEQPILSPPEPLEILAANEPPAEPPPTSRRRFKVSEVVTAVFTLFAVIVSLWAAWSSNHQAEKSAHDERIQRLRDDLNQIAALSVDLNSEDARSQNIALSQMRLLSQEAADLVVDLETDISALELAFLANNLTIVSAPKDAERLFDIALEQRLEVESKVDVLAQAAINDFFLDQDQSGRSRFREAMELSTEENFGGEVAARDARGRVVDQWFNAELLSQNCAEAAEKLTEYEALLRGLPGSEARIQSYRTTLSECSSAN